MALLKDIIATIEAVAPLQLQEDYDNAGLQCGDPNQTVERALCCLDVTEAVVQRAIDEGCQLIVSHHPLLFRAIRQISAEGNYISRCLYMALRHGVAIYSAHTNLDNAPDGVNRVIADRLGLIEQRVLSTLPASRLQGLDSAFASRCGSGMLGLLPEPMSAEQFVQHVRQHFGADAIRLNTDCLEHRPTTITKVALCGGAGADFIADAEAHGANAYLTGEVGYHRMFGHPDILLVEVGHFESEQYTVQLLQQIISDCCTAIY